MGTPSKGLNIYETLLFHTAKGSPCQEQSDPHKSNSVPRAVPKWPWEAALYQRQAMSRKHGGKTLKTCGIRVKSRSSYSLEPLPWICSSV